MTEGAQALVLCWVAILVADHAANAWRQGERFIALASFASAALFFFYWLPMAFRILREAFA